MSGDWRGSFNGSGDVGALEDMTGGNGCSPERANKLDLSQIFFWKTTGGWKDCCNRLWLRRAPSIRERMINFEPDFSATSAWKKRFFCLPLSDCEAGRHFPSPPSSGATLGSPPR